MFSHPFDDRQGRLTSKVASTCAGLVAANVAAWGWAWLAFADRPAVLGTAFLAYIFGLRHAFDADHIAAIDNVVRKLVQDGKAPHSAGLFFSLGHSTIVVLAAIAIAATTAATQADLDAVHAVGGVIGTSVSASFLLVVGIANLFILKGVWRAFTCARRGETPAVAGFDGSFTGGGLFASIFRPLFRTVAHSWQMYPIGFLFGLGFDTATEIGLLGISASQAAEGLSFWSILVFPALFTAGMSLLDTADSVLMTKAYGSALNNPIRKLWYNLTITAASVVVAVFIGGLEALGLIGDRLGLSGGLWGVVTELNRNLASFGYAVVGIFVASYIMATWICRTRGVDALTDPRVTVAR